MLRGSGLVGALVYYGKAGLRRRFGCEVELTGLAD